MKERKTDMEKFNFKNIIMVPSNQYFFIYFSFSNTRYKARKSCD